MAEWSEGTETSVCSRYVWAICSPIRLLPPRRVLAIVTATPTAPRLWAALFLSVHLSSPSQQYLSKHSTKKASSVTHHFQMGKSQQQSTQLEACMSRLWMNLCCIWCHQSYFNSKLIFYIVRLNIISVATTPICSKAIAALTPWSWVSLLII